MSREKPREPPSPSKGEGSTSDGLVGRKKKAAGLYRPTRLMSHEKPREPREIPSNSEKRCLLGRAISARTGRIDIGSISDLESERGRPLRRCQRVPGKGK